MLLLMRGRHGFQYPLAPRQLQPHRDLCRWVARSQDDLVATRRAHPIAPLIDQTEVIDGKCERSRAAPGGIQVGEPLKIEELALRIEE